MTTPVHEEGSSHSVQRQLGETMDLVEHQLWYHYFPGIALETVPVLRLRALPVPCDYCQNRSKRATHTIGGLEITSELPNDRPFAVKKLPAIRAVSYLQPVAGREGGNGAMHWMITLLIPREAEKDVSQAEPPNLCGQTLCN